MDLVVEELNLDDFDINNTIVNYDSDDSEISVESLPDDFNDNCSDTVDTLDSDVNNIIYSYPYYSDDTFDYEYRLSLVDDNLILDEVKCDDNEVDFDNCVSVLKTLFNKPLNEALNIIKTIQTQTLDNEVINFEFNGLSIKEKEKVIENNKKVVLKELYNELLLALSN